MRRATGLVVALALAGCGAAGPADPDDETLSRLKAVEDQTEQLDERVSEAETKLEGVEEFDPTVIQDLDERLSAVEEESEAPSVDVDQFQSDVEELRGRIDALCSAGEC